ncbi:MAG: DUF1549 domain-containing protein [Planctomycetia bacterium]|nr:DUF1549 domain-containing protein [Planctomycetia bacterium]
MSSRVLVRPVAAGSAPVRVVFGDGAAAIQATFTVRVGDTAAVPHVDFVRDVNPVLTRLGCNQGTCHGAAKGKNGFKLSLRGYDPAFDLRAFTDDHGSRRVNLASPDDSLMLLKAAAAVPHTGGLLASPNEPGYQVIRRWIEEGARLDASTPRVTSLAVTPPEAVIDLPGRRQQFRVVATYADGSTRDVTRLAFLESGNIEVATADATGLVTAVRRGEAPILVRYEGAYAAIPLTVMGDRSGFAWRQPETWGPIDELVAAKWQAMQIEPAPLAGDAEFLRRVTLDLTGLPPTAAEVRAFLADRRDTRIKRAELVQRLLAGDAFVEHWTNKWANLLQVNPKFRWPPTCPTTASRGRSSRPRVPTASIPPRPTTRRCGIHSSRWRTRPTSSSAYGSTATSATTIRSSAGPRTSTTRRRPSSRRWNSRVIPRARAERSADRRSRGRSRSTRS